MSYCFYVHDKGWRLSNKFQQKEQQPEYADYWCYTNGWIVRAAQKASDKNISDLAYQYLQDFYKGKDQRFLTNSLQSDNGATDVLTAAHHGLINLERGNIELATAAGNYLCNVLKKQPTISDTFYFRFDKAGEPITDFDKEKAAFFCMKKK